MSCAVAAALNSPVFSSSPMVSPIFYKPSVSPPITLNLQEESSSSSTPSHSPPTISLLQPLTLRFNRQQEEEMVSSSCTTTSTATEMTLFKRKRPAMINIPMASLSFSEVEVAEEVDRMDEVEFEGDGYAVYCKRGKRRTMEDRYSAVVNLQGDSKQAFFGVFDGHGGAKAAEFAANNIDRNIMKEVTRRRGEEIEEAVKDGFLATDAAFLKEGAKGGTCCLTALIRKGDLVVSNTGDCRAILSRGGIAEALTVDHRPSREDERDRIETMGGYVGCSHGVWRIQGSLAVSRGIGDQHLKKWVVAEPDTKVIRIRDDCEFLILASDGLWDKVSNQEAVDVVRPSCIGVANPEPFFSCKKLVGLSVTRGSTDDVSVMVIQLARFLP